MKKFIGIIIAAAILALPSLTFAKEGQIKVMTSPVPLLFGALNVQAEYFVKPEITAGFDFLTWSIDVGDETFNMTTLHPFGRFYFEPDQNSFFAGGGFMSMDVSFSEGGSASASGLTLEGGYNWTWETFTLDLGYEMWMLGTIESSSGESFDAGSIGGLLFRVGAMF